MRLAAPPPGYDRADQAKVRAAIAAADTGNFKKGEDVELARGERFILRSPDGHAWSISVSNAGVLSATGPL